VVLICMMIVINKKSIMGEYVNNRFLNIVSFTITAMLVILSLVLLVYPLAQKIFA
jgi:Mn2+/Fe2+ NRAMP family transporter